MNWKIVPTKRKGPYTLTSAELLGVSILLAQGCGEPQDETNVYWRAWNKIQREVEQARQDY